MTYTKASRISNDFRARSAVIGRFRADFFSARASLGNMLGARVYYKFKMAFQNAIISTFVAFLHFLFDREHKETFGRTTRSDIRF